MKMKTNNFVSYAFLLIAACISSISLAQGQGGGGGNPNANSPGGGLSNEVNQLQLDVIDLQAQVDALNLQNVFADCATDSGALQAAIDSAPAAGVIISVGGACDPIAIDGKANILIDGGGSASISGDTLDSQNSAVYIAGSRNIQIAGTTVSANGDQSAMEISAGSSVALADMNINGGTLASLYTENSSAVVASGLVQLTNSNLGASATLTTRTSSFTQLSGTLDIDGILSASFGSSVQVRNGTLDSSASGANAIFLQRQTALQLLATGSDSIVVNGNAQMFSGSSFTMNGEATASILLSSSQIIVQRNSSVHATSPAASFDIGTILVRQNSVLDMFSTNFVNTPNILLQMGAGARGLGLPGGPIVAGFCEAGTWVNAQVSCPL